MEFLRNQQLAERNLVRLWAAKASERPKEKESECDCDCRCDESTCSATEPCCDDCTCGTCGAGPYEFKPEEPLAFEHVKFWLESRSDDDWYLMTCDVCDWQVKAEDVYEDRDLYALAMVHDLREALRGQSTPEDKSALDRTLESVQRRLETDFGL